jgi:hypothetical protein
MPDSTNPETFAFSPAVRARVGLSIAIAGSSGSGKTKSALEIATGLAGPDGKICVIDTEGRRALHYATQYRFDHLDFQPPYTPERCTQAITDAQNAGYDVVIFDSASDEYEGEGGIVDIHDAEARRMATYDGKLQEWKIEAMNAPAWKAPKLRHKTTLIRRIRAYPGFVIFCLRAEEKVRFEKVKDERSGREKTAIVQAGWIPICEKRFMYDMTLSLTLAPETKGKPRFDLAHKITDDHLPFFPEGEFIGRMAGEQLRAWATGAEIPQRAGAAGKTAQSERRQQQPTTTAKPYKWTSGNGKVRGWDTAAEWTAAITKAIAGWPDDALQPSLDTNIAEIRSHMTEADSEHAYAILSAFSARGVAPPPVKSDGDEKELPL